MEQKNMIERKLLDVTDAIPICRSHEKMNAANLKAAIDKLLEGDCILGINKETFEYEGFGQMEEGATTYQMYCLIIYRQVPETDEQYLARCRKIEQQDKEKDERDRLEYLRLKAKFENQPNI